MSDPTIPKLNLNTATLAELQSLPGIRPAVAKRIVARRQQAPFQQVDDLWSIRGVKPSDYEQVTELIEVETAPPETVHLCEPIRFASAALGEVGASAPPLTFCGTPDRITGTVPLLNVGQEKVKLTTLALENTPLLGKSQMPLQEVALRQRLQPGQQIDLPVTLEVDRHTPPGTYEGEFVLAGERRPFVVYVAEVVSIQVVPTEVCVEHIPGSKVEKTFYVTNQGNKPVQIGNIGSIGLEEELIFCHTIRRTVGQLGNAKRDTAATPSSDLNALLTAVVDALAESFTESNTLTVRTKNKPVVIAPGETVKLELEFTVPRSLRYQRQYRGKIRLFNASISLLLQPMNASAGEEPIQ
jgi:hypothetical protein